LAQIIWAQFPPAEPVAELSCDAESLVSTAGFGGTIASNIAVNKRLFGQALPLLHLTVQGLRLGVQRCSQVLQAFSR
jgi:hypothetical protein